MPKRETYVPKHRAAPAPSPVAAAPRKAISGVVLMTGVAVAATGVTVAGGVAAEPEQTAGGAAMTLTDAANASDVETSAPEAETADLLAEREPVVSRSDSRDRADARKQAALDTAEGPAVTRSAEITPSDPRDIAKALLPEYGLSASEFSCLDSLYVSESNWNVNADNPSSSAYGIPQALTETHDLPAGYMTSAEVQIRWGLDYIVDRYGTPCQAWSFKQGNNWY